MSSRPELKIDWATYEAAKYACQHWHYSGCVPAGKNVYVGVWEREKFKGVVIFGTGVAPYSGKQFNINQQEIAELVRIALTTHESTVTRIVSIAIKFLKRQSPGLRLLVSFADPEQGHNGAIYQAGNWLYAGTIKAEWFEDRNKNRINTKTLKTGRRGYATKLKAAGVITSIYLTKHKYLMPLDDEMRKQIEPLRKPYPKRVTKATSGDQLEGGGAIPTHALQNKRPKQAMTPDQGEQRQGSTDPDAPIKKAGEP